MAGESFRQLLAKSIDTRGRAYLISVPDTPSGGVTKVPSQIVYEFRSRTNSAITPDSSPYFAPGSVISICESPAFSKSELDETDSGADGLGCARAIRSAFFAEASLALVAFGIWHLWHIVR